MFRFRLRFKLPADVFINSREPLIEVPITTVGGPYVLTTIADAPSISDARELVLSSRGFDTEAAATQGAIHAKGAVLWAAAKLGIGIDVGRDTPIGVATQYYKDQFAAAHGKVLLNDVHGITVYNDSIGSVFGSMSANPSFGKSGDAFATTIAEAVNKNILLSAKEFIAFELYSHAQFERAQRTRLVLYVAAIESLLETNPRETKALAHVNHVIALTAAADIEPNEKRALLTSLEWLRSKSIGHSARALIRELVDEDIYGGKKAAAFFTDCYRMRSRIVHDGAMPSALSTALPELQRLLRDVLVRKTA